MKKRRTEVERDIWKKKKKQREGSDRMCEREVEGDKVMRELVV